MSALKPPQGILGGTFDPIHVGHLHIANAVADALVLSYVRLIPAGAPPHRAPPLFSADQRLRFCELSARGHPRLHVDPREVYKTTPSFTIETLEQLRAERPTTPQVLILGADAFLGLPRWYRWQSLMSFCHIAVVNRPGFDLATQLPPELKEIWSSHFSQNDHVIAERLSGVLVAVSVTPMNVSATQIRALRAANQSLRGLVADSVLAEI